ncbi:MAG TPA: hypothetical protein VJX73_17015 [Terracidiphilus sp.]|nr:hypothetical protein [Terracidiphilus sp.]
MEAADTPVALVEAYIAPAVAADRLLPLAEPHIVPVLAARRPAGVGPLRLPGRFARHPQLAR